MKDVEPAGHNDNSVILGLLSAIESDDKLSQRRIASDMGIALGLVNAYIKRCVRKGLVKVSGAPANRYLYYLTPIGFAEKSRLTLEYLRLSFVFFRDARRTLTELFVECRRLGRTGIVLMGAGELAEAAILSASEVGVTILGIVDAAQAGQRIGSFEVMADLDALFGADGQVAIGALVITDLVAPHEAYWLARLWAANRLGSEERVLVPTILPGLAPRSVPAGAE